MSNLLSICQLIKDEYFLEEKASIIMQIKSICNNLPCPQCAQHATSNLKKMSFDSIHTKKDLTYCIWAFHNIVNKSTHNPQVPLDFIDIYKYAKLNDVLKRFIYVYKRAFVSNRYIMYKFHSQLAVKKFIKYMRENQHKFNFN